MKHIIFILFLVAAGFNCVAQNNKAIDNNEVNRVRKDLVQQVKNPMNKMAEQLAKDINSAQALCEKLKNRKFEAMPSPSSQGENKLEEYLNSFSTLEEMFAENTDQEGYVLEQISTGDNPELKTLYQLIFAMKQSLNEPYDEASNNKFIKEASNNSSLLPQHKPEFDKLVSQINDYNYYMFELARLFVAADEDKYSKTAEELVKDEDAEYLMEVPYTSRMLRLYRQRKGQLNVREKTELKNACADAFPDF